MKSLMNPVDAKLIYSLEKPSSKYALAKAIGYPIETIRYHVKNLMSLGIIVKKDGKYALNQQTAIHNKDWVLFRLNGEVVVMGKEGSSVDRLFKGKKTTLSFINEFNIP